LIKNLLHLQKSNPFDAARSSVLQSPRRLRLSQILREIILSPHRQVQLAQGDLTAERVDAIVNAANRHLQHGGGLAGTIVRVGGASIQVESDDWVRQHGLVAHDAPAYTGAGKLPCKVVIHAVGPIWGEGDEDRKLAGAVTGSLRLADHLELASIAMPAISTGIFGFPKQRAAGIILSAIEAYFTQNTSSKLSLVRITLYDQPTLEVFQQAWDQKFPSSLSK
jgi:O-acetyl-ADP-ribose deacetylase (regulator of RNase III)